MCTTLPSETGDKYSSYQMFKLAVVSGAHSHSVGSALRSPTPENPSATLRSVVVDMKAPGIEVRPLREMTGTTDFSEVFFNGVRVPAENMIGQPGEGWKVATQSLVYERAGLAKNAAMVERALDDLVELAKRSRRNGRPGTEDAAVRQELAKFRVRLRALGWGRYTTLTDTLRGEFHVETAPIGKIQFSELNLDIAAFALELLGPEGLLVEGDPASEEAGRWQDEFLYARAYTIAGGANEIMRNMISERGLLRHTRDGRWGPNGWIQSSTFVNVALRRL